MKITQHTTATFEFSSDEFVIVATKKLIGDGGEYTAQDVEYTLNYLVDRSYAGKDPDVGQAKLWLEEGEMEELRKAGFSMIEM